MPELNYRPLAYKGPSGLRIEFSYDGALEYGKTHNLGEFQFAGTDEKHYQDRSLTSAPYDFLLILNNQLDEELITALLDEKTNQDNPGFLEHPIPSLGTFPVVVSSYKVSQHEIKGSGRIGIQVSFLRNIPSLIGGDPVESNNPASASAIYKRIQEINNDQANIAAESVQFQTGSGFGAYVESTVKTAQNAKKFLGVIAAKTDEINIAFNNTFAEIISEADTLAREPFTLTRKIQNLIQLPMLAVDSVSDRIDAYKEYVNETLNITESENDEITSGSPSGANILTARSAAILASISAIGYSAVSGESATLDEIKNGEDVSEKGYLSRPQVADTIKEIQDIYLNATDVLSQFAADFGATLFFNQYFDFSILDKTFITSVLRNLLNRIFSAVQEKRIVNKRDVHPDVLCAEFYGSAETSTIQFFCASNKLHGDELYIVPAGKDIVYYG